MHIRIRPRLNLNARISPTIDLVKNTEIKLSANIRISGSKSQCTYIRAQCTRTYNIVVKCCITSLHFKWSLYSSWRIKSRWHSVDEHDAVVSNHSCCLGLQLLAFGSNILFKRNASKYSLGLLVKIILIELNLIWFNMTAGRSIR